MYRVTVVFQDSSCQDIDNVTKIGNVELDSLRYIENEEILNYVFNLKDYLIVVGEKTTIIFSSTADIKYLKIDKK